MAASINHNEMRNANEKLVLQQIFNNRLISRTQISKNSGLHKSTISSIFDSLFDKNLIVEVGEGESTNVGGRKPSLISFNKKYGYIITFDIGRRHLRMANFYMNGQLITYKSIPITQNSGEIILSLIKKLVAENAINDTIFGLQGIGLSITGVIYNNKITYSPFVDFSGIDLATELSNEFNVHTILENEANLSAIYLRDFIEPNNPQTYENFISVDIHNGIGVGIIIHNELYRGIFGGAGEYGRSIMIDREHKTLTEELFSEDALIAQAGELSHNDTLERNEFLDMYEEKNPEIIYITKKWVKNIAQILYNLFQIFAPEAIYVNSRIIFHEAEIYKDLNSELVALNSPIPTNLIEPKKDIEYSTLYGALALVTRSILDLSDNFELTFSGD